MMMMMVVVVVVMMMMMMTTTMILHLHRPYLHHRYYYTINMSTIQFT
jgi:hypothetical protein